MAVAVLIVQASAWLGGEEVAVCPQPGPAAERERQCRAGDTEAYVAAGHLYADCGSGSGYRRAVELYGIACTSDHADGCLHLGGLRRSSGTGVENAHAARDAYERAATLFRGRCGQGDPDACAELADMIEAHQARPQRFGVAALREKARVGYERACEAGAPQSCSRLVGLWGQLGNTAKAAEARQRACMLGDGPSCCDIGTAKLSLPGNEAAAEGGNFLKQACDAGDGGCCAMAGSLYEAGSAVARDEAMAAALYERGCGLGRPLGCFRLGLMYRDGRGVTPDARKSEKLLEAACAGGVMEACAR